MSAGTLSNNVSLRLPWPERFLDLVGGDTPESARLKLTALRTLLIVHEILEMGLWAYDRGVYWTGLPVLGLVVARWGGPGACFT